MSRRLTSLVLAELGSAAPWSARVVDGVQRWLSRMERRHERLSRKDGAYRRFSHNRRLSYLWSALGSVQEVRHGQRLVELEALTRGRLRA
jgi:hypothetical protein